MEEKDLAQSFNDYIEPSPVPFHFGAPGWYFVLGLVLLILACVVFFLFRFYRRNRYRKQAILFLNQLQNSSNANSHQQLVYETAILLKRVAMAKYGRSVVAGLSGEPWIQWLNNQIRKSEIHPFDQTDQQLLSDGIYKNQEPDNDTVSLFIEKTKNWIQHHHAI